MNGYAFDGLYMKEAIFYAIPVDDEDNLEGEVK